MWVDFTRSLTRVFIPLAVLAVLVMISQGVVQNFSGFKLASTLVGGTQQIPGGPVASMEAIKLLGTNGGSMYGAGGAHPFENPTGFTNPFDLLLVIVLPFAIIFMFGRLIGRGKQALAIAAVMAAVFLGHTVVAMQAELHGLAEVTYAYASAAQNNGSAFAGLAANTPWYDITLGLTMLIGRFGPTILALAIAGSLAGARVHARTRATLDTAGATFAGFLVGVIVIVGGLIYFPMLILGPIGERITG